MGSVAYTPSPPRVSPSPPLWGGEGRGEVGSTLSTGARASRSVRPHLSLPLSPPEGRRGNPTETPR
ncbi:hypothetical protein SAMN06265365_104284 [Tistlia consotensis]|uniref:Uncharacterized protein n=1 Tax=Tistlia consotensis USBA 355 TaxID=560819 RepID=A0A1Y6BP72_9PROT|nr:hypothetical protein SAMN05428998_10710 [Tistlia consotensis USBA 355]SNR47938.1 hypothetical protein SAMN06265365_104284 [Tistlia consotensis]